MPYSNILVDLNESHSIMCCIHYIYYILYTIYSVYRYILFIYTEIARLSFDLTNYRRTD